MNLRSLIFVICFTCTTETLAGDRSPHEAHLVLASLWDGIVGIFTGERPDVIRENEKKEQRLYALDDERYANWVAMQATILDYETLNSFSIDYGVIASRLESTMNLLAVCLDVHSKRGAEGCKGVNAQIRQKFQFVQYLSDKLNERILNYENENSEFSKKYAQTLLTIKSNNARLAEIGRKTFADWDNTRALLLPRIVAMARKPEGQSICKGLKRNVEEMESYLSLFEGAVNDKALDKVHYFQTRLNYQFRVMRYTYSDCAQEGFPNQLTRWIERFSTLNQKVTDVYQREAVSARCQRFQRIPDAFVEPCAEARYWDSGFVQALFQ